MFTQTAVAQFSIVVGRVVNELVFSVGGYEFMMCWDGNSCKLQMNKFTLLCCEVKSGWINPLPS